MVKVDARLVFVVSISPFIGATIEAYVAYANSLGKFDLNPQKVNSKTVASYAMDLSQEEMDLLKIIYNCDEEELVRKFSNKKMKVSDYFSSIDANRFKTLIRPNIEGCLDKALALISNYRMPLFLMNKNRDQIFETPLVIQQNEADAIFNFVKHEHGISYRLMVKVDDLPAKLLGQNTIFLTHKPCWMILNQTLLRFDEEIDSLKLSPFTQKEVIEIPLSSVDVYIRNFIQKIFNRFDVETDGIRLIVETPKPTAIVTLDKGLSSRPVVSLSFDYDGKSVLMSKTQPRVSDCIVENGVYTLKRVDRNLDYELSIVDLLRSIGLKSFENVHFFYPAPTEQPNLDTTAMLLDAICQNYDVLVAKGVVVKQGLQQMNYFVGQITKTVEIHERNDWFDVDIQVSFGAFSFPFVKLRSNIINKIKEFVLPDSTIAIIPEEWFGEYSELLNYGVVEAGKLKLKKYHLNVLSDVASLKTESVLAYEAKLKVDFVQDVPLPSNLQAALRSYQYQGYQWMKQLEVQGFSGCLADDMGLGKTIQTIAVLLELCNRGGADAISHLEKIQYSKQMNLFNQASNEQEKVAPASLIVVPLSLIYNWQQELARFAPSLMVYVHSGVNRNKSASAFHLYDIVLTTYGMVRSDIELFRKYEFNYVVLDESQNVRNPLSKAYRAVRTLQSHYRLALTGTPIENSLVDLWAQFNFLNPGLLGGVKQFRKDFVIPIEKQNDLIARDKLKKLLQPFLMRRTKEEVAPELPPLTEVIQYCDMTDEQRSTYESVKSTVRNSILFSMASVDRKELNIVILRGLMQLRLVSNHPKMLDPTVDFMSGKHMEIREMVGQILQENHKVIIFSQFVKHLKMVAAFPEFENERVLMLTGITSEAERRNIVREFQENEQSRVLMMTLKAGGVGLNLTAADYILLIDPWWNPAAESQAIARAHRIGQDKKVFAYRFITKDSIEEKIINLQNRKRLLANDFVKNSNPLTDFTDQDLLGLFE